MYGRLASAEKVESRSTSPQTRAVNSFSLFYFTRVTADFPCRVILPTLAYANFSFKTGSTRVK